MTRPLVTVIIPTCDRPQFLGEALDSVRAQTFRDYEVIVVEDGSRTAADVVARCGFPARHVWQPKQGVSAARNTGARAASGAWLAFLDDDDLWLPTKLDRQLELAVRSVHFGMLHTERYIMEGTRLRLSDGRLHGQPTPSGWIGRDLLWDNFILTSSTLVRRDHFDAVGGFDTRLAVAEDYHLWLRLARRCQVGFVPEPLTIYRLHGSGLSDNTLRTRLRTLGMLEDLVSNCPSLRDEWGRPALRKRRHALHLECAYLSLGNRAYRDAGGHFLAAWWSRPSDSRALARGVACATGGSTVRAFLALRQRLRTQRSHAHGDT